MPSSELAIARIKKRVREGGHHVPEKDVRRRFSRGIDNFFNLYEPLFNSWFLFDNSKAEPVLVAKRHNSHKEILDVKLFSQIRKLRGNK